MRTGSLIILIFVLINLKAEKNSPWDSRDSIRHQILNAISEPESPEIEVDIVKMGARGDSLFNCLPVFNKAIKLAETKGGVRINVPSGVYFLKGPLKLVSNMEIHLEDGARLKFSEEPKDYLPAVKTSWEGTYLNNYCPFIYAYKVHNVRLTGNGTIDGNASRTFNNWKKSQTPAQMLSRKMNHEQKDIETRKFGEGDFLRPQLIQFFESSRILISDLKITNSPFWCVHLLKSENIIVRGISFDAKNINNDGIDPECSRNILIEDVDFDNGDDNVAIKAGRDNDGWHHSLPCENILIRNCRFKGLHAIVVGSEMSGGVRNVVVENCSYDGFCKRAIYIKSNPDRGGYISDLYFDGLNFDKVEDLFFITSYYHGEGSGHATDIHDIFVKDINCNEATNAGIIISGYPERKIKNVSFENINLKKMKIGVNIQNAEGVSMSDVFLGEKIPEMPSFAQ